MHETLAYLERQQQTAAVDNLRWFEIKIYLLQALAHHALGATESARAALTYALHLAQPEGFVRVFVDEGEPAQLLILEFRVWISQQPQTEPNVQLLIYIDKLLANFNSEQLLEDELLVVEPSKIQNPKSKIQNLVEPLSEREREVLALIATGLSNSQIAAKLIVTTSTVKTHINRIFGKLAVQSRTQAIGRARELGLLSACLTILWCNDLGFSSLDFSLIAQLFC